MLPFLYQSAFVKNWKCVWNVQPKTNPNPLTDNNPKQSRQNLSKLETGVSQGQRDIKLLEISSHETSEINWLSYSVKYKDLTNQLYWVS